MNINSFDQFAGNREEVARLREMIQRDKLPHTILLEGPAGSGKRTLARLTAQAAVCAAAPQNRPCGECAHCKKAAKGIHPDIFEAAGGTSARSFHIETVREVKADVFTVPNEAARKVYILANASAMTVQAQNSLLKMLEEPPSYALFVLTAQSRTELLPTVVSRCTVFSLGGVSREEGVSVLHALCPEASGEQCEQALAAWGGIIGQAAQALMHTGADGAAELAVQIAEALLEPSELPLLRLTGKFEKNRELLLSVLRLLVPVFRDALASKAKSRTILSGQAETPAKLAAKLTSRQLITLIEECEKLEAALQHNANLTLTLTRLCPALRRAAVPGGAR